jgi:hypothetical protein
VVKTSGAEILHVSSLVNKGEHVVTPVEQSPVAPPPNEITGVTIRPESTPAGILSADSTPVDTTPVNTTTVESVPVLPLEPRLALTRTKKRLYRPVRAEDAHTDGENRLYQFMWANAEPHAEGTRVYTGSMTTLARALGRDDRNTRPVVEALIRKLSIAIGREQDFRTGHPRMYLVFDPIRIQNRRQHASLEWAVKNKGIQLLTAAEAARLAASDKVTTPVNTYLP